MTAATPEISVTTEPREPFLELYDQVRLAADTIRARQFIVEAVSQTGLLRWPTPSESLNEGDTSATCRAFSWLGRQSDPAVPRRFDSRSTAIGHFRVAFPSADANAACTDPDVRIVNRPARATGTVTVRFVHGARRVPRIRNDPVD